MTKSQLVSAGIMTILLVSNLIIGYQYKIDTKKYQRQLDKQYKIIKYNKSKIMNLTDQLEKQQTNINKLNQSIKNKDSQIHNLKEQLQETKKRNEKLQQQLVSRGKENNKRKINMIATAYIAFCDTGCIGITRTGKDVTNTTHEGDYRVVAVDPTVIPLYSLLKIETKDQTIYAIALDTGRDIVGNRIDILVKNNDIAFEFGRQNVTVTVLREGKG